MHTEKKRGMILNRIEKQVDRIIAGLKVNEALKNVRFHFLAFEVESIKSFVIKKTL